MYATRLGPMQKLAYSVKALSPFPPKWKGLIITGSTLSGVQYLSQRLVDRGYRQTPTPMEMASVPTFTVVKKNRSWDLSPEFHRVYVVGVETTVPDRYHRADSFIESNHRGDANRLLDDLGYLLKE